MGDQDLGEFIKEYNLQNIESELYDEGTKIADICSKTSEQIDEFAKKLTSNVDDQNNFKNAISDRKSKMKQQSNDDNKSNDNEDDKKEQENWFEIYVKTLTGKTMSLNVTQNTSIKNIKQQIEEKEGIAQKQQKLVFAGKSLDNDSAKIGVYNIKKHSIISLVLTS